MSLRGNGRLFSIVAKQIRKKHLEQNKTHTQNRRKSRTFKLKQYYQIPQSNNHMLYLYSNRHGNEFILKEQNFEHLEAQLKYEAMDFIRGLHRDINKDLYRLWSKKKQFNQTLFFPSNQQAISITLVIIIVLFTVVIFFEPLLSKFSGDILSASKDVVFNSILISMLVLIFICGIFLCATLNSNYQPFDYDHEVVKSMASLLKEQEKEAQNFGFNIQCDRDMTWIRFRLPKVDQTSNVSSDLPTFKREEDNIMENSSN